MLLQIILKLHNMITLVLLQLLTTLCLSQVVYNFEICPKEWWSKDGKVGWSWRIMSNGCQVYDIVYINVSLVEVLTKLSSMFLVVFKNIIVPTQILHEWPCVDIFFMYFFWLHINCILGKLRQYVTSFLSRKC